MNFAQRVLLTRRGHQAMIAVYVILSIVSIVVYTVKRSPLYGLGQFLVLGLGLAWIIWCLRRHPDG